MAARTVRQNLSGRWLRPEEEQKQRPVFADAGFRSRPPNGDDHFTPQSLGALFSWGKTRKDYDSRAKGSGRTSRLQLRWINQAHQERLPLVAFTAIKQLVNEAAACLATVHNEVFQVA